MYSQELVFMLSYFYARGGGKGGRNRGLLCGTDFLPLFTPTSPPTPPPHPPQYHTSHLHTMKIHRTSRIWRVWYRSEGGVAAQGPRPGSGHQDAQCACHSRGQGEVPEGGGHHGTVCPPKHHPPPRRDRGGRPGKWAGQQRE